MLGKVVSPTVLNLSSPMAKDTQRYKCVVLLIQVQEKKGSIRALSSRKTAKTLSTILLKGNYSANGTRWR